MYILQSGFGGTPTADSRLAVPCPSDRMLSEIQRERQAWEL
jgi:hypothetical protein